MTGAPPSAAARQRAARRAAAERDAATLVAFPGGAPAGWGRARLRRAHAALLALATREATLARRYAHDGDLDESAIRLREASFLAGEAGRVARLLDQPTQ